jgi:titin
MPVRPPGTPTLTAIDSSLFELELHWTAGTAGTLPVSYVVYRASPAGAPFAAVTMLPGTFLTYNDNDQESGLTSGTTFVYRVQAVDSSGMTLSPQHASGLSNPLTAVTGTVLVNPPRNVAAFAASNAVTVTWSPAYDPTVVIVQTLVYRATDGVSFSLAASYPAATLVYVEPAPSNGVTYTYYLQSVTAAPVTSSASATVTARPAAPPGVPLLSGTDGDSSVTLVLGVPTPTFGGLPVSTLVLSRNPGVPVTFLALSSPITHLETGLANGSGYVYQAQAFDVNGVPGSASSPVTGFPYVLGVPVSLSASVTVNGALTYIRVGYEAPVVNSFPVTGYQYFTSQTPGVYGPPNGTGNSISRAVTGVGYPGVTNYFVVRAVDEKNHVSAASEEVSERITLPPQAPATLRAVAGDGQVLLDWPDAAPGTLPVSFYVVTRNGAAAATVTADRSWWLDLGTTDGSPQTYVVTAYDAFFRPDPDAHESAPTVAAVAASADGTPNPVAGLEAGAIDDSRILLEWPRPNDLGGVVTAYAVLRSTGSMPAVYPVTVARVPDTLALETLSFTDSGLDPGTTYHYVLVAEYATGDSGYSNEAQATTLPRLRNVPTVRGTGQALLDRNVVRPMRGDRLGIYFRLAEPADVEIHVYNVAGELMAEVHYGPAPAGDLRSVDWDVKDRLGSWVASGLYLVEVTAGPMHQVLKVAVIR